MTTIPYDAYLRFHGKPLIHAPVDVDGYVVTHDGESDPFFVVNGVWIDGVWFRRPGYQPLGRWEENLADIVEQIEADEAFLRLAMDAEGKRDPDAAHEFHMGIAAE